MKSISNTTIWYLVMAALALMVVAFASVEVWGSSAFGAEETPKTVDSSRGESAEEDSPAATEPAASELPVFRFALENWQAAPVGVVYFCQDATKIPERDNEVLAHASKMESAIPPANINVLATDNPSDDRLSKPVQRYLSSLESDRLPIFITLTPWGWPLSVGDLTVEDLDAMFNSPVRTRLGELMADGTGVVLLIIAGSDEADNERVMELAEQLAEEAEQGHLKADDPGSVPLSVAALMVSRNDQRERWLIDSLLACEATLADDFFRTMPIVFPVYGRARFLPPLIGSDITHESLAVRLQLLGSRCLWPANSPMSGCDLPMAWDWDRTVTELQSKDEPSEESSD